MNYFVSILILMLISFASIAEDCPQDFLKTLEGNEQTTLYKQHLSEICREREVQLNGKVVDIGKRGDLFEMRIDSIPSSRLFVVVIKKDQVVNLAALKKGTEVRVKGVFKEFGGYINDYIDLNDGQILSILQTTIPTMNNDLPQTSAVERSINKCVGPDGKPIYQKKACPDGSVGSELKIQAQKANEEGGLREGELDLLKKSSPSLGRAIEDAEWNKAQMEGRVQRTRTRESTETTIRRTNPK